MPTSQLGRSEADPNASTRTDELKTGPLLVRCLLGGILMGLANLVPGISGGTMLLAAGVYPQFISAVADTSRFKFRPRSLLVLLWVSLASGMSILLLAGTLKSLVVTQRWAMYSLFIGLTLGGIPVVWRLAKPANTKLVLASAFSFLAMVALAVLQAYGFVGSAGSNFAMLLVAGLAGASAMILPGLSGGYLLLLLGQYVPILSAIDTFKEALRARDFAAAMAPAFGVMLPVGIGVVAGVAIVGNALQWLLLHYRKPTLGVLLGLLLGSTVGLYPFQVGIAPGLGTQFKGQEVTAAFLADLAEEDWPTEYFLPTAFQGLASIALITVGFGVTVLISKVGGNDQDTG